MFAVASIILGFQQSQMQAQCQKPRASCGRDKFIICVQAGGQLSVLVIVIIIDLLVTSVRDQSADLKDKIKQNCYFFYMTNLGDLLSKFSLICYSFQLLFQFLATKQSLSIRQLFRKYIKIFQKVYLLGFLLLEK